MKQMKEIFSITDVCPPQRLNLVVRLNLPARPPESTVELLATSILETAGSLPFDRLVERIADELYRQELRYAWALDIGMFGSRLFVPSVAKEIETGNGSLWKIQEQSPANSKHH
jgi:hypothetical protein